MNKTANDFMTLLKPVEKPKWLFAIRQLRLDKNWMQHHVALALNMQLVEYSSIENAKRLPNADFFQKFQHYMV